MNSQVKYNEEELVAELRQKSEKAFSYLYDNYSGALYGVITSIVIDLETANDVLQETFLNIWKNFNSYDAAKGRLFTWMLNIARNGAIDKLRSRGFKNMKKNQPLNENVNIEANLGFLNPTLNDFGLKKLLLELKEEQRTLVELSFFQGYTHEEISKIIGIPLGTVKTRIGTALIQLRTMIK
jgi:RNA polymerase sigma-70 factor (ECF subfamily)